jgi:large subunit ribosomal protein L13
MLFRPVHVPAGDAAHVRRLTGPHAALSFRVVHARHGRRVHAPSGTMPHAAWSSRICLLMDGAASGRDFAYHATFAARSSRGLFHAMKTYVAKPTDRERNWLVVDANGKTLGRLATQIADVLRGKRKPEYTPHIDTGDFVVVINAEKVAVSGKKRQDKRYYRHSGYPGGLRSRTFEEMLARRPEEIVRLAVKGMMPRNRLSRKQITKLKIYAGPEHPHVAQKPQPMEIEA